MMTAFFSTHTEKILHGWLFLTVRPVIVADLWLRHVSFSSPPKDPKCPVYKLKGSQMLPWTFISKAEVQTGDVLMLSMWLRCIHPTPYAIARSLLSCSSACPHLASEHSWPLFFSLTATKTFKFNFPLSRPSSADKPGAHQAGTVPSKQAVSMSVSVR